MQRLIQGAKGGGKGGGQQSSHVPTEASDTASSRSYAKFLEILGEGEIEGLSLPGLQGVYFDGTPIENEDGSFNFTGIDFTFRTGTQQQDYIPAFPSVERERVVNVEVLKGKPIIEAVNDLNIDAVRVKVAVPRLQQQKSNGDIVGYSVTYGIETKASDSSWVRRVSDTMSEKSSGRYEREYSIALEGVGPWQVRVVRDSGDDNKSAVVSSTFFSSMTEVILAKLTYPNSALAGLIVDSSQFSSIPVRTYLIKGLRLRVPSNYDPLTREYSGVWDGSFKIAWSSNPAWGLYEILSNDRFGLGKHLDDVGIDKWGLYQIARHCDEMVPDGLGGMEPRYELHCYIKNAKQALRVVNEIVSCFSSMAFWDGQQVMFSQDKPSDPTQRFTNANVKDGKFSYSGSSKTARHTVALVEWVNKDNNYQSEIEYVADNEGIKRYGYNPTSVAAFGSVVRGQANRVGRRLLFTERLETEVVSFTAGLKSVDSLPGDVIEIADQYRAGQRFGGRITASNQVSVTIDSPINVVMGETYTLSVALPDGGYDKRLLTNDVGEHDVLVFDEPLTDEPLEHAIWVVSASNLQTSLWRIITAVEKAGEIAISALSHNPEKNQHIEQGLSLSPKVTTRSSKVLAPVNLSITEQLYESAGRVLNSLEFSCDVDINAVSYQFSYNRDFSGWVDMPVALGSQITLYDAQQGSFLLKCRVKSALGVYSAFSHLEKEVLGKTAPPENVSNLVGRVSENQFRLSWDVAADLDVLIGGRLVIRHSLLGDNWDAAVALGESISGSDTSALLPLLNGVYLAKFVDSSGKESVDAVSVVSNVAGVLDRNVVAQVEHGPVFSGAMQGFIYDINQKALSVDTLVLFDSLGGQVDDWLDWDGEGGYLGYATYELQGPDLGSVFTARISVDIAMQISRVEGADPAVNVGQTASVVLDVSQTDDDPSNVDANWSAWQRFSVSDFSARATRYRVVYRSGDKDNVIKVSGITVSVDMADKIETQTDLSAPVEGLSVEYANDFFAKGIVPGVTANNMQTGDYFDFSQLSPAGFYIQFFNASAQPVARRFNYLVKSY